MHAWTALDFEGDNIEGADDNDLDANEIELAAYLLGAGTEMASAKYEVEMEHGVSASELDVRVKGLAPGEVLDVVVGGVMVGQITADANGNGELELTSSPDDATDQMLPVDLAIDVGTTVQIGPNLSGTFALGTD